MRNQNYVLLSIRNLSKPKRNVCLSAMSVIRHQTTHQRHPPPQEATRRTEEGAKKVRIQCHTPATPRFVVRANAKKSLFTKGHLSPPALNRKQRIASERDDAISKTAGVQVRPGQARETRPKRSSLPARLLPHLLHGREIAELEEESTKSLCTYRVAFWCVCTCVFRGEREGKKKISL